MEKLQLLRKVNTQPCMTRFYLKTSCGTYTAISSEAWFSPHLRDTVTLYVLSQLLISHQQQENKIAMGVNVSYTLTLYGQ